MDRDPHRHLVFSRHLDDRGIETTNHVVDHIRSSGRHRQGDGISPALSPSGVDQRVTEPYRSLHDEQHDRRQGDDENTDLTRVA